MQEKQKAKDFYTTSEAAKVASVTPATIRNWISKYNIGILIGGRYRISKDKLHKFIDKE